MVDKRDSFPKLEKMLAYSKQRKAAEGGSSQIYGPCTIARKDVVGFAPYAQFLADEGTQYPAELRQMIVDAEKLGLGYALRRDKLCRTADGKSLGFSPVTVYSLFLEDPAETVDDLADSARWLLEDFDEDIDGLATVCVDAVPAAHHWTDDLDSYGFDDGSAYRDNDDFQRVWRPIAQGIAVYERACRLMRLEGAEAAYRAHLAIASAMPPVEEDRSSGVYPQPSAVPMPSVQGSVQAFGDVANTVPSLAAVALGNFEAQISEYLLGDDDLDLGDYEDDLILDTAEFLAADSPEYYPEA